jgi:hypothetical protein
MDEIVRIGNRMSNVFFNWSQQDRFSPDERRMMKELQKEWDDALFSKKKPLPPGSYKRARGVLKGS